MQSQTSSIFRKEAVEYHELGHRRHGDLLRISPAWTQWFFWLVLAVLVAGLLYIIFGTVPEYAEGVAVIRSAERTAIHADSPGNILSIAVRPGQRVREGELLATIGDAQKQAELERVRRQYDLQLISYLKDPNDQSSREALITLRARKELAEARQEEREVTAPRSGVVGDVRVETGRHVSPGEVILSLIHDEARPHVVAMLPGHHQPLLQVLPRTEPLLSLELEGYGHSHREQLRIESVGETVIGPSEVRRYLDDEIADSLSIQGPIVLVQARLESQRFQVDGRWYRYHHGMHATVRVKLGRPKRIVFRLMPWLERLFRENDG